MRDTHGVQRAFELFLPEGEEAVQFGEFGEEIVVLPDVGLQQPAVVWAPIQDVRGRQTITTDLFTEILRNHSGPPSSRLGLKFPFPAIAIASRKGKQVV